MPKGISIHIGVNHPTQDCCSVDVLTECEAMAESMAQLAERKGFRKPAKRLVGSGATHQAVTDALVLAAGELDAGDILFVSFSGHGCTIPDLNGEEPNGDEAWCLSDAVLVDDQLADYLRRFRPGVRILIIAESCYSGGIPLIPLLEQLRKQVRLQTLEDEARPLETATPRDDPPAPCRPPRMPDDPGNIQASILLLSATSEQEQVQEGVYVRILLDVLDKTKPRTYCELHHEISRIMGPQFEKLPDIRVGGADHPGFPGEEPFFIG